MTSLKGSSQFCVFCYKRFVFPGETVRTSCDTKKFVKLLSRFVNCQNIENDTLSPICWHEDKFLKCCNSCNKIIKSFCELYHNLKLLELQLDLQLNKLVDKIDYANKVPTRWISLNKILEDFFRIELGRQTEVQSSIRSFRQNVVKAGNQRKLHSHPRVLLTKNEESFRQINKRSTTEKLDITDHLVNDVTDHSENDVTDSEEKNAHNSDKALSKTESTEKLLSKRNGKCFIDTKKLRQECKDMKCPICKHQSTSFRSLYVHLEYVHKYANLLKLQCGECGKRFCSKYYLTRHLKQHSREKPFVCRFCGLMYQAKHGLKLHLEEHHMEELDEEGIEQELNTKVCSKTANYQSREFEGNGNVKVRRHNVPKHEDRYTVKKNGLTNVPYFRKDEDVADNKPVVQDELVNKNADGSRIQSTIFQGKDTISVDMKDTDDDDEIGTEYVLEGEEINYGTDEHCNNTGESTPEAIFMDPQIQIKLEHPSVSFNNSCENASTIIKKRPISKEEVNQEKMRISFRKTNISYKKTCTICGKKVKSSGALVMHMKYHKRQNDNLNAKQLENKRKKNDFSPITKFTTEKPVMIQDDHEDDAEIHLEQDDTPIEIASSSPVDQQQHQQQRYGLREKRICKFRSLGEMDSDDDDSDENQLVRKYKKAAAKNVETHIGLRQINSLRRNRNRIISAAGPKALIVECDICSRKFTSFLKKEHHFKVCHDPKRNNDTGKIFRCKFDKCTAYFLKRVQLKFHYKLEHRKLSDLRIGTTYDKNRFACPTCERRFPFKSNLKIHMEYHKNPSEWKWECGTCGKKSASEYKLKAHMTKHTNEKPNACRFCEEKFRVAEQLKEHYIKSHGDEEDIRTEIESKVVRCKVPSFLQFL